MNGEGGTLLIYGVLAGTLAEWSLRREDDTTLTLTAEGQFNAFWLSIGARRAVAIALKTQSPGRGYAPTSKPATPIELRFEGDVSELSLGRVTLRDVKLTKGAE